MILRLLKNHPTTARVLRRETKSKKTSAASASVASTLAALVATGLALTPAFAQDGLPAPSPQSKTVRLSDLAPEVASKIKAEHFAVQGQNIQRAYYQQLQENRQRFAASEATKQASYQQAFRPPANGGAFPRTAMSQPDTRLASPAAAPAPAAAYAAPPTFMPPVHITPPTRRYVPGVAGRSTNGHRNAVQNFAPQTRQQPANAAAYRQPVRRLQQNENLVQPQRTAQRTTQQPAQEDTHVFLQDRISNALSRHFKRGSKSQQPPEDIAAVSKAAESPEASEIRQEVAYSVVEDQRSEDQRSAEDQHSADYAEVVYSHQHATPVQPEISAPMAPTPTPTLARRVAEGSSYSAILASNKYASSVKDNFDGNFDDNFSGSSNGDSNGNLSSSYDLPQDHQIGGALPRVAARQRTNDRASHVETVTEAFEINIAEDTPTILDRYEEVRQASAQAPQRRRIASKVRRRPVRNRIAAYRPQIEVDTISILQEEEDDAFRPQEDFEENPFRGRNRDRNAEPDDRAEMPNMRDDLKDADSDDDRSQSGGSDTRGGSSTRGGSDSRDKDRVRSRLDDDLDPEELDDPRPDDDDDEDLSRPNRAPQKSCREFQQELIAGSIRDISLDISPPAASEGAQYGGIARTWTDQNGNVLATGALADIRRGYVILDSGQKLAYARLSEADLAAVSDFWRLPDVCVIGNTGASPYRSWAPQVVTWKASNLCHKPLYFENVQLERYGHSRGPIAQPLHSTLHFFVSLVSVPYQTAISPPNECEYALGFYRPGSCAPWLKDPIPISLEGIRREALFVTGAAFIP